MRSAVVIEAARTPIGRAHAEKGMFRDARADELSADVIQALLGRSGLPPEAVEEWPAEGRARYVSPETTLQ